MASYSSQDRQSVARFTPLSMQEDVIDGSIVSGEWIKLAAKRFLRLKDDSRYIFREDKADKVVNVFSMLRRLTGKHAGRKFILQPWQQFIIASIYGFYVKDTGKRLVNYVFIEMARKNGKTAFAAGLCLYHLIADGESDAEVDLATNSKDQAKIAFKFCKQFSKGLDSNEKYLRPYRDKILYDRWYHNSKCSLRMIPSWTDSTLLCIL